jgi:hypothetical protein
MNRGWSAADVDKGKSLKKMTIVEFLRISICDFDNHYDLSLAPNMPPLCERFYPATSAAHFESASGFQTQAMTGSSYLGNRTPKLVIKLFPHRDRRRSAGLF